MKYRVFKPNYDHRLFLHGVNLPDGFFRVFELTEHNGVHVESLMKRYEVIEEPEDLPCGIYDVATSRRVTDESLLKAIANQNRDLLEFLGPEDDYDDPMKYLGWSKEMIRAAKTYRPPLSPKEKITPQDIANRERVQRLTKARA